MFAKNIWYNYEAAPIFLLSKQSRPTSPYRWSFITFTSSFYLSLFHRERKEAPAVVTEYCIYGGLILQEAFSLPLVTYGCVRRRKGRRRRRHPMNKFPISARKPTQNPILPSSSFLPGWEKGGGGYRDLDCDSTIKCLNSFPG